MPDTRIVLVTGANQGVGRHVAKELATNGLTVLVGSRNFERGAAAVMEIGSGAIPIQLDVTDRLSIAASLC
jgi:NAD(P)-dependent dehydrogenase (short-subunit alcohol dehydrogenase family)